MYITFLLVCVLLTFFLLKDCRKSESKWMYSLLPMATVPLLYYLSGWSVTSLLSWILVNLVLTLIPLHFNRKYRDIVDTNCFLFTHTTILISTIVNVISIGLLLNYDQLSEQLITVHNLNTFLSWLTILLIIIRNTDGYDKLPSRVNEVIRCYKYYDLRLGDLHKLDKMGEG